MYEINKYYVNLNCLDAAFAVYCYIFLRYKNLVRETRRSNYIPTSTYMQIQLFYFASLLVLLCLSIFRLNVYFFAPKRCHIGFDLDKAQHALGHFLATFLHCDSVYL